MSIIQKYESDASLIKPVDPGVWLAVVKNVLCCTQTCHRVLDCPVTSLLQHGEQLNRMLRGVQVAQDFLLNN